MHPANVKVVYLSPSFSSPHFHYPRSECDCFSLCYETAGCSWYTWFSEQDPLEGGNCYLLTSCDSQEICDHCFTGPIQCGHTTTAAPVNEVIFIAGGDGTDTTTELLDIRGVNTFTTDLPDSRRFHTSHLLGGSSILVCGGDYTRHSCISTTCLLYTSPSPRD